MIPQLSAFLEHAQGIIGLSAYSSRAGMRVIFQVRYLYDAGVDGSDIHQVSPLDVSCVDGVDVAPDGRWILCLTSGGLLRIPLDPSAGQSSLVPLEPDGLGLGEAAPAWSPDGRRMAIVESGGSPSECLISLYARNDAQTALLRTASLALPGFPWPGSPGLFCHVSSLSWSPDGSKLAFLDVEGDAGEQLFTVDVPASVLAARPSNDPPLIGPAVTQALGSVASGFDHPVWLSDASLAAIDPDTDTSIDRISLDTGQRSTLLSTGHQICDARADASLRRIALR